MRGSGNKICTMCFNSVENDVYSARMETGSADPFLRSYEEQYKRG
jgi:hypothetical protein